MILVQTKAESAVSSPLSLTSLKDEKPILSFSELLRGAKDSKDEKGAKNGPFILSLGADTKELKLPLENTPKDLKPVLDLETK
nr:hypothetical protein [Candidatus Sulfurimonas ponti]